MSDTRATERLLEVFDSEAAGTREDLAIDQIEAVEPYATALDEIVGARPGRSLRSHGEDEYTVGLARAENALGGVL